MLSLMWRKTLPAFALSLLFFTAAGCADSEPSSYDQVKEETSQRGSSAVSDDAQRGGEFNQFFPTDGDGYNVVFTQEKQGFAQAKLERQGQEIATLSINDTVSVPESTDRYTNSSESLAGYPVADIGRNQTGMLVGDRYQVKVVTKDSSFTPQDRRAWLQRFDLDGLSKLQ
ncbi:hypothetical protein ACQ4M4_22670 [Leptolyngbya sp. AN02str]|uniref:hypothetical protein n=1 Tax=Leptolyngbya sp. AN02str TaxID=3423363 RepID=UPI003D320082